MFVNNLNPDLLHLGPFTIRFYGIVYATGFLFTYFYLLWAARQNKIKGLQEKDVDWLVILMIIGVILGARAYEVFVYNWSYYQANPGDILKIWQGGLAFHGALAGSVFFAWLFCRKKKIHFLELLDFVVVPAALFVGFGRIANFINGELWGKITNVPWCVYFKGAEGCRHPSQLYEAAKNFFIFVVLIFTSKKKHKPGFIFSLFLVLYGALRFSVEFLKEVRLVYGLNGAQWLSLGMIIIGIIMLYKLKKRKEYKEEKKAETPKASKTLK